MNYPIALTDKKREASPKGKTFRSSSYIKKEFIVKQAFYHFLKRNIWPHKEKHVNNDS